MPTIEEYNITCLQIGSKKNASDSRSRIPELPRGLWSLDITRSYSRTSCPNGSITLRTAARRVRQRERGKKADGRADGWPDIGLRKRLIPPRHTCLHLRARHHRAAPAVPRSAQQGWTRTCRNFKFDHSDMKTLRVQGSAKRWALGRVNPAS